MDFGKAFTFPFQDPEWARKLIIPALIGLIPIFGQVFLLGWMLGITRRVMRGDPTPLPELELGPQFIDGLKGLVIGFVYAIPIFLLQAPIIAVATLMDNGGVNPETGSNIMALFSVCCGGLILLYSLLIGLLTPAALGNFIAKERVSAAFNLGQVLGLVRAAPGAYLLTLVGLLIAGILIAPLGAIACFIGAIFTGIYAMAVGGHLYGQAYNEASGNRGVAQIY